MMDGLGEGDSFRRIQIDKGSEKLWEEQMKNAKEQLRKALDEMDYFILIYKEKDKNGGGSIACVRPDVIPGFLKTLDGVGRHMMMELMHASVLGMKKAIENEGKDSKDTPKDDLQGPKPESA